MSRLQRQYFYRFLVNQLASKLVNRLTGKPANRLTNKGSIFILSLWALFFLAILAVGVSAYVCPQLNVGFKSKDTMKMYEMAKAGTKVAILVVDKDETDSYDALKDIWSNNEDIFKDVILGDGTFSIVNQLAGEPVNPQTGEPEVRYGLIDEERKININKVNFSILKKFFELVAEISSQDASDIAASIIDWCDIDEEPLEFGAESGYYLTLEPPYPCKNKNFEVLQELLLIKGMNQEIFDKVKDRVTIYGLGAVNINTADELTLEVLGMSQSLREKVIHFREGPDAEEATEDDNVFESVSSISQTLTEAEGLSEEETSLLNGIVSSGFLTIRSDNFMGESFGCLKEDYVKITFVFNRNKCIKYWRQD